MPFKTIKLQRTMCYGTCPVFELDVKSDGQVTYFGKHYVQKEGEHTWTIDVKAIEKLNYTIEKWAYFLLKQFDDFISCTDMPSCITSVEMEDGRKRTIDHYLNDCAGDDEWPKELKCFEKRVEKIVGVKAYVGEGVFLL